MKAFLPGIGKVNCYSVKSCTWKEDEGGNWASLEASKRLHDAGIVLETEKVWFFSTTGWELVDRYDKHKVNKHYLPAPSMAEVWRELPEWTECKKQAVETKCVLMTKDNIKVFFSENPTDALIDLLIFVRKEKP